MRPIGGEIEKQKIEYSSFFTDSGRSSLRLFFRSADYKYKKVLIPNFLCDIVVDVLKEEEVDYDFYIVNETLNIDIESVESKDFDILYVIHYFGAITNVNLPLDNKILIEDYVFHYQFENRLKHPRWFAFNSFRKISAVTDGSHIKTNMNVNKRNIEEAEAPFVALKKKAKEVKYDYVYIGKFSENLYLDFFEKGEREIDSQNKIFTISNQSLSYLLGIDGYTIQKKRAERYKILNSLFSNKIEINPKEFSFFLLNLKDRDDVRTKLRRKNIFLPIHWGSKYVKNSLSNKVLSVPLFENIPDEVFSYLVTNLKDFVR